MSILVWVAIVGAVSLMDLLMPQGRGRGRRAVRKHRLWPSMPSPAERIFSFAWITN